MSKDRDFATRYKARHSQKASRPDPATAAWIRFLRARQRADRAYREYQDIAAAILFAGNPEAEGSWLPGPNFPNFDFG